MQSNVIEKQYIYISKVREHQNKRSTYFESTRLCRKNNNSLFILRFMHKLFSYSIFCNSYLDLASSYKWKKLITQMELISDMDQHHNLFRKRNKKIVGNGHKCLYIYLKMQI